MAKEKTLIEIGDKLRYNGISSERLTNGAVYEVTGLSESGTGRYVDNLGTTRYLISGIAKHFELVEETAESGGDSMGCANTKLKKGDFVRYLGGDPIGIGNLTVGKVYVIEDVDSDGDASIYDDVGNTWYVCEETENAHCFVKVFDELSDGPVISDYEKKAQDFAGNSLSALYPKYYKDVSSVGSIDVYMTHKLFDIDDPSGAIQHASKKLLLSGVRTGGKSKYNDIKEARDTLNRWLEIYEEESE